MRAKERDHRPGTRRRGAALVLVLVLAVVALAALGAAMARARTSRRVDRWYAGDLAAAHVARSAVEEALAHVAAPGAPTRADLEDPSQALDLPVQTFVTAALLGRRGGLEVLGVRVRKRDHVGKRYSSVGFLEVVVRLGRRGSASVEPAYEFRAVRYFLVIRVPGTPTEFSLSKGDLLWQKSTL